MTQRQFKRLLALAVSGWLVTALTLVAGLACGQPTSQPAVTIPLPAASGGWWAWVVANAAWLVPLAVWVLSTVATLLSRYPRAKGLVAALRLFMGGLSLFEFKDGKRPGLVFKLPVVPPTPPPDGAQKA